ncbi:MAG: TIM barrel protein [Limisphaerales bacterium]
MNTPLSRRSALSTVAAVTAATAALSHRLSAADAAAKTSVKHSVCKWCYREISLEDLCKAAKGIGLSSIELLEPADFPLLKKYGLHCAMVSFPQKNGLGGIGKAFNRLEHHDTLVEAYTERIQQCAGAGFRQLICFSGNRAGLDDEAGVKNCAIGLKRLMPLAEKHGVTLVMELLNSRVNHKDYQCDKSAWGIALCKAVGSERFKLLYDIYHMQIMEGDVIATIKRDHQYFAHYHTGGVPGRNEIDDTQELNYPAIIRAIQATGYAGHVGQEFIPKREDKLASLKQGVKICDV